MKIMLYPQFILLILITLLGQNSGFAQCGTSATYSFTENFDTPIGTITDCGSGGHEYTGLRAGQTEGSYAAACSGKIRISDNAEDCMSGGADTWKTSSTGGGTGSGGGVNNYAYWVDGCGTVADGSVWCKSVTVAPGEKYSFSADLGSQWDEEHVNDPDAYFTINGVQVGTSTLIEQYTSAGATPYQSKCFMYTIPAGTSGTVDFCINLKQRTGSTATSPGSGSYGADGQGNDILIDNIQIHSISGAGCTSGSACTFTLPVELIIFEAKELSGSNAFLHWTSAYEKNAEYFSVEKSLDGLNFTEIGTVKARGNSSGIVNYEYSDFQFNESSYYRLKITDADGSFKYSKTIGLMSAKDYASVAISEVNTLEIKAVVSEDKECNLAVYSLLGIEYINEKIALKEGENSIVRKISGGESAKIIRITALDGTVILSKVIGIR
jgi:hypothetical protein